MWLLWLLLLGGVAQGLNVKTEFPLDREFVPVTRFEFSPTAGVLTVSSSSSNSTGQLMLVEEHKLAQLLARFDPLISYCDFASLASHSFAVPHEPFQTLVRDGGRFDLVYVKKQDCLKRFNPHNCTFAAVAGEDIQLQVHLQNWDWGVLQECTSIGWLGKVGGMLIYFALLVRFQLATTRLVWRNTGKRLALFVLVVCVLQHLEYTIRTMYALVYFISGNESHANPPSMVLLSQVTHTLYLMLLLLLSQGWMIVTPTVSKTSLGVFTALGILALVFPSQLSTVRLVVFVWLYSGLVRLMKQSRAAPGAVLRGKVWGPVALLLVVWYLLDDILFPVGLLVWTTRAEVIWELHGERPHLDVVKILDEEDNVGQEYEEEVQGLLGGV
ncbi:hypothetical protein BASA81_016497 [Batrachochytrium salamandrivorans]|nr:hypothetical protein BASA81_016497 [Batrachochytrium salamandrivorans]